MVDKEAMSAHIEKALDESRRATAQLEAAMSKMGDFAKFRDDVAHHLNAAVTYADSSYYYVGRARSI